MASTLPGQAVPRLTVVVMGVCGTGKTAVATGIAQRLGLGVIEGDDLHDAAAVAKMRQGTPLTDTDRWPWLARIGVALADAGAAPSGVAASCSALRLSYRDRLRQACPGLQFVFLDGDPDLIARRMGARSGHYMPTTLLQSQLQTLERPGDDEPDVVRLSIEPPVADVVDAAVQALRARRESPA
jgi:carbohydrate kinase (thermoresistant glucokinase family)